MRTIKQISSNNNTFEWTAVIKGDYKITMADFGFGRKLLENTLKKNI